MVFENQDSDAYESIGTETKLHMRSRELKHRTGVSHPFRPGHMLGLRQEK